ATTQLQHTEVRKLHSVLAYYRRRVVTDHAHDEEPSDDESSSYEEDFYPVTNPQGYCLIINISEYDSGSDITLNFEERQGSDRDVDRVKQIFERLRFIVKIKKDLTAEQLDDFLHEIKKSPDLAKHGSFVCFLMAHGSHDCIYGKNGVPCEIRNLTEKFKSSVCRSLEGKPKVFFIQACRGSRRDRAVARSSREQTDEAGAPVYNSAIRPAEGDFLLCYATTPGSAAFRNIDSGSRYVQTVCEFIEKYFRELDLITIMTKVSGYLHKNPVQVKGGLYHVVPQKVDQLSSLVSFDPERARKV
uniref:Caspase-3 n=1 Tax=Macrostomum lignano TaxID=282301 RepID=A0A1I8GRA2_9PLAT